MIRSSFTHSAIDSTMFLRMTLYGISSMMIEERSFLLRTMERQARDKGNHELGRRLAAAAERDETHAQGLRALTVKPAAAR